MFYLLNVSKFIVNLKSFHKPLKQHLKNLGIFKNILEYSRIILKIPTQLFNVVEYLKIIKNNITV